MQTTVRRADHRDLGSVLSFYEQCGYAGGATRADAPVIAELDGAVVGAVRVAVEGGVAVLRGMQVAPAHQRRGIGTRLLTELDQVIGDRPCFCLAYAAIERMYTRIGFKRIPDDRAPVFLRERLATYLDFCPSMITLKRDLSAESC